MGLLLSAVSYVYSQKIKEIPWKIGEAQSRGDFYPTSTSNFPVCESRRGVAEGGIQVRGLGQPRSVCRRKSSRDLSCSQAGPRRGEGGQRPHQIWEREDAEDFRGHNRTWVI